MEAFKNAAAAASNAVSSVAAKQAAAAAKMAENIQNNLKEAAAVAATAKNQQAELTAMEQGNHLAIERRSKLLWPVIIKYLYPFQCKDG